MVERLQTLAAAVRARPANRLAIAQVEPFSTLAWPGKLAAMIHVRGCPWDCRLCQHRSLRRRRGQPVEPFGNAVAALVQRQEVIDAVLFGGAEPLADPALPAAVATIRALGFAVGLQTCGLFPDRLAALLPLLDWVRLDFQIPSRKRHYAALAWQSLRILLDQGVAYEIRTVVDPRRAKPECLLDLAQELAAAGVDHYAVQEIHTDGNEVVPCPPGSTAQPAAFFSATVRARLDSLFPNLAIRRLDD